MFFFIFHLSVAAMFLPALLSSSSVVIDDRSCVQLVLRPDVPPRCNGSSVGWKRRRSLPGTGQYHHHGRLCSLRQVGNFFIFLYFLKLNELWFLHRFIFPHFAERTVKSAITSSIKSNKEIKQDTGSVIKCFPICPPYCLSIGSITWTRRRSSGQHRNESRESWPSTILRAA